jgi:hypothetical protein
MRCQVFLGCLMVWPFSAIAATAVVVGGGGSVLGIPLRSHNDPAQVSVVTSTGYIATYLAATGQLAPNVQDAVGNRAFANEQFFESSDCSGPGFIPIGPTFNAIAGGVVMSADPSLWGAPIVFVHKNPFVQVRSLRSSRYVGQVCVDRSSLPYVAAAVVPLPNNPSVTGVSGATSLPMRLEVVSDCVFANGFECPK